jgi:hypothetical protein
VKAVTLAIAALTAATVSLAQQTPPQTPAEPRTSSTPKQQTAPPADPRLRISETDKLILLGDCMSQMQAAHPSVPEKDAKAYCDKRVKSYSFPRN